MSDSSRLLEAHRKEFGEWLAAMQDKIQPRPSDRQIARAAGLSPTHYGDIKKGVTGTTEQIVERLAIALGIDPNVAVRRAFSMNVQPTDVETRVGRRLGPIISKLPPEKWLMVENALEQDAEKYVSLLTSKAA